VRIPLEVGQQGSEASLAVPIMSGVPQLSSEISDSPGQAASFRFHHLVFAWPIPLELWGRFRREWAPKVTDGSWRGGWQFGRSTLNDYSGSIK
jgi:hypothetical protein